MHQNYVFQCSVDAKQMPSAVSCVCMYWRDAKTIAIVVKTHQTLLKIFYLYSWLHLRWLLLYFPTKPCIIVYTIQHYASIAAEILVNDSTNSSVLIKALRSWRHATSELRDARGTMTHFCDHFQEALYLEQRGAGNRPETARGRKPARIIRLLS